jgi:hypothetical protein
VIERLGGTVHPGETIWLSGDIGTSRRPSFSPRNTWQFDGTVLVARHTAVGLEYRHWNYAPGPVDILIPHVNTDVGGVSWDLHVFLSNDPLAHADAAFALRATRALSRRASIWLLGGAGQESYSVGSVLRSLKIVTGGAGVRYNAANGLALRFDASVVDSRPILARRGIAVGVERGF